MSEEIYNKQPENPNTNSPHEPRMDPPESVTFLDHVKEIVKFTILAAIVVLPIRAFVAQPFIVSGDSMYPTFETGQYLIIEEIKYRFNDPGRGDVIVFRYPNDPSKFFIKRIVGLPDETVEIRQGKITIKNEQFPEGLHLDESYVQKESFEDLSILLDDDEYFVMGDNRSQSSDSRFWGPLEERFIVGRAFIRLLPVTKIDYLPGQHANSTGTDHSF